MKFSVKFIVLLAFWLVFGGCVSKDIYRGHELTKSAVAQLKVNKSTKDDVVDVLGHPSFASTFNDNVWYYVSVKRIGVSPFNKGVNSHKVLELHFKNNVLSSMQMHEGSKQTKEFDSRKTPVQGDNVGVFKDFVSNLGKFNKKQDKPVD